MFHVPLILTAVLLCSGLAELESFRILGICPSTSYSHQQPFQALMKALAARDHHVTVISPVPQKKPIKNYEDVDVSFTYRRKDCTGLRHINAFSLLRLNMLEANKLCEEQLFSPAVRQLISKNETFDAIVIEQLWFQCYYALVKHYNFPPLIGFLSVGNLPYVMDSVGNPDDPFLNPDMAFGFTDKMNMKERILNALYTTWTRIYYRYCHLPDAETISRKLVPETSVSSIDRNFSLVILGNNHIFGYSKPLLPHVIEVHSLQIANDSARLTTEIQQFLDGASDGAIYFSLGSNLQSHQLPSAALSSLCDALSALDQRILWKGDSTLRVNSSNIRIVKWAPQQAILAHPNVKLYMMQGGLQSLQEAIHYGVPVIAIPFFGDQNFNARKILEAGIGRVLEVDTMTKEVVLQTIKETLSNDTYSRNIKRMGDILKDEQVKPMHRAIWHVEHLLKFPDSKHFKYHGRDITWTEYYGTMLVIVIGVCALLLVTLNLFIKITKITIRALKSANGYVLHAITKSKRS